MSVLDTSRNIVGPAHVMPKNPIRPFCRSCASRARYSAHHTSTEQELGIDSVLRQADDPFGRSNNHPIEAVELLS